MGDGGTKERHHLIANMTVYGSAVAFDGTVNGLQDAPNCFVQILGVEQFRHPGIARNVREHDSDLAAFSCRQ